MKKTFFMTAERFAHDGSAEGIHEGIPVRVCGMFAGEQGVIEVHKKHGAYVGELKELHVASERRKTPEELHYLACSPWQVMDYAFQAEIKHGFLSTLFSFDHTPKPLFVPAAQFFGYRTKIEFSFTDRDGSGAAAPLSLAFHARNGGSRRIALPMGCALASEAMNRVALCLCARLRERGCCARDLKSLVVRESKSTRKIIAILYVKNNEMEKFSVDDISDLFGFLVYHSTEKSPASVPTKELWRWGEDSLVESICGLDIAYSWDSFFQNNIPVFESALSMIKEHVSHNARAVELYSGVGTIGLALSSRVKDVRGVEIVENAVWSVVKNAKNNNITNYSAVCTPAEKMKNDMVSDCDILILDPPRVGLHPHVINMIKDVRPPKIIYLSCNPETQARDYALLRGMYGIDLLAGFDFYPQTPHCESLAVLSLRHQ